MFVTTDRKDWAGGRALFVDGPVDVDMSSLVGGEPVRLTADQLYEGFRAGLHAGKSSHHMATNHRVEVDGDRAELWANGYAWNHVAALPEGAFHYYSKLTRGNDAVRAHPA